MVADVFEEGEADLGLVCEEVSLLCSVDADGAALSMGVYRRRPVQLDVSAKQDEGK